MLKTKNLIIVSACLMTLGIGLTIGGFTMGGSTNLVKGPNGIGIYDSEDMVTEKQDLSEFDSIDVYASNSDVEIIKSDKFAIEMKYNNKFDKMSYVVENKKLTVKSNENDYGIKFIFNMTALQEGYIKIYIPEKIDINNVVINNKSGEVTTGKININDLFIQCDFGNVELSDMNSKKVNVLSKSGNINIKNITSNDINMELDFGRLVAEKITTKGFIGNLKSGKAKISYVNSDKIELNGDFGDIIGSNIISKGCNINAKSGTVKLQGELAGENNITSDFGDVELSTTLEKNTYSYNFDVDFGSSKIDGNKLDGSTETNNLSAKNNIDIKCKSGNIDVKFNK